MKSLVLQEPGVLAWVETPEPVPSAGEALVRVRRCGVCGTDIHALAGKQPFFSYPRRLGHELCVEVVEAPAESGLKAGDLCSVEALFLWCLPSLSCGQDELLQKPQGARGAY
jgi:threonine dehydrogenase-like Zn-dependent dehydrogenase